MITWGTLPPLVFDHPWVLLGAVAGPLLVFALHWRRTRQRAMRLRRFADESMLPSLTDSPESDERARAIRFALIIVCIVTACAGPRWGMAPSATPVEGIDMVIAMDASLSMLATDERPSRLERMKREVRRLRALAPSDRVALLAFAGRSYILTPLTLDDGAVALYLDHLDPSVVGQAGSSLSHAIRQGTELLMTSDGAADRALVVLSDGESFEDEAPLREAAIAARDAGIRVILVGFGSLRGATIPIREGNGVVEKRDRSGAVVMTRHVPTLMQRAAAWADGIFIAADEVDKAGRIRESVRALRTARRAGKTGEQFVPRHRWLLIPAWLLLAYDSWRLRRRRRTVVDGTSQFVHMALIGSVWLLMSPLLTACTQPPDPAVLFTEGRSDSAVADYRAQVAAGDSSPRTLYNLGTALLGADSTGEALPWLEAARRLGAGEIRFRARFNTGLTALELARGTRGDGGSGDPGQSEAHLAAARAAYRALLVDRPGYRDAQWNYELALRTRPPSSGGGGGGAAETPPRVDQPSREESSPGNRLDRRQAEALLDNAAREEGAVQGRRVRTNRRPVAGNDW